MADFRQALKRVLEHEGLYASDPNDPGGETFRGVARKFHPTWPGWTVVDALRGDPEFPAILGRRADLSAAVEEFYHSQFWNPLYDEIAAEVVGLKLFDFGVNAGVKTAVKLIQRSVHALIDGRLPEDGQFGRVTLGLVNAVDPDRLLAEMRAQQAAFYARTIIHKPDQDEARYETFLLGWMRRVME